MTPITFHVSLHEPILPESQYCCPVFTVLLGPLQAVTYLLTYGTAAWVMGSLWVLRSPWWLSVAVASLVRAASIISYLAFTSWTLNENVYRLLVNNIHSVVVRAAPPHLVTLQPA